MTDSDSPVLGFEQHDHRRCIDHALQKADAYCLEHSLRFTPVRRRTLGILLESHAPAFLICSDCGSVAETKASKSAGTLSSLARKAGFQIEQTTLEAVGQCPGCQEPGGQ